jgi:hypothetical protein
MNIQKIHKRTAIFHLRLMLPLTAPERLPRKGLEGRGAATGAPPWRGEEAGAIAEPRKARFSALCAENAPKFLMRPGNKRKIADKRDKPLDIRLALGVTYHFYAGF